MTMMEAHEVELRLINGEDELSISIEKWQRLVDYIESMRDVYVTGEVRTYPIRYGSLTCALCRVYSVGSHTCVDGGGRVCPLAMHGMSCNSENSPWHIFAKAVSRADYTNMYDQQARIDSHEALLNAAKNMRDVLINIQRGERNDKAGRRRMGRNGTPIRAVFARTVKR